MALFSTGSVNGSGGIGARLLAGVFVLEFSEDYSMKYLILGNGPAGVVAAETLRRADQASEIVMVGS